MKNVHEIQPNYRCGEECPYHGVGHPSFALKLIKSKVQCNSTGIHAGLFRHVTKLSQILPVYWNYSANVVIARGLTVTYHVLSALVEGISTSFQFLKTFPLFFTSKHLVGSPTNDAACGLKPQQGQSRLAAPQAQNMLSLRGTANHCQLFCYDCVRSLSGHY